MASTPRPLSAPDVAARLRARFGDELLEAGEQHGHAVVRVTVPRYHETMAFLRDDPESACDFCDFVTVVDRQAEGFEIVTHVASTTHHHGVRVKVLLPREAPAIATISDLYPTADWHERECMEMFGVDVVGHPEPVKLLLPEQFEGFPMRKEFALMSRVAKPWPGAAEGEGEEDEDE